MPTHHEQRLLPYTPDQLYSMVADIESYPKFLPWCAAARILQRDGDVLKADLVIKYKAFHEKYTSRVELTPPAEGRAGEVHVSLVEGPFAHLTNDWRFTPDPAGTILDFHIDFRLKSFILEKLMAGMFDSTFGKMMQAFEKRAAELFGRIQDPASRIQGE